MKTYETLMDHIERLRNKEGLSRTPDPKLATASDQRARIMDEITGNLGPCPFVHQPERALYRARYRKGGLL